ncbi:hypothetical protein M0802_012135 [Mischocyttarus mexicanus]|nr:hypothetical protein M0802_012135 [Mischocyttarus mexicanus]
MPGIPVQNSTTERLLNSRRTNCNLISNYKPTCLVQAKLGECIVATIGLATLLKIICWLRHPSESEDDNWCLSDYNGLDDDASNNENFGDKLSGNEESVYRSEI